MTATAGARAGIFNQGEPTMSNTDSTRRNFFAASAAAVAAAASAPALAQAQAKPDASIEFTLWRAGFIVGGSGGSGILHFKDNGYNLNIGGVSLGATIGVARTDFVGEVYNLKQAKDIEGTYTAIGASGALAGGAGVAELQNSRGVRLRVSGRQIGLMVSIDLSGMQVSLRS
jgi:lipid-binding SYLF domain-containing protein